MARLQQEFDTPEDLTHVMASQADDTSSLSLEFDNTTKLYLDRLVRYRIKTGASGVSATGKIFFYAVASIDDSGRVYPSNNKGQLSLGLPMVANANGTVFTSAVFSVKKAFNGNLPNFLKIVVDNQTGVAFDGTEGNHEKRVQGQWIKSE